MTTLENPIQLYRSAPPSIDSYSHHFAHLLVTIGQSMWELSD